MTDESEKTELELLQALGESWDQKAALKALITDLCDALDRSDPIQISIQEVAALIDRAREATR